MRWLNVRFDWNRARAFLVTAEEGSLSAAARALGLTQPTLGRQVAALEQELGVTLFERVGRSLSPTQSGLELLDHVREMGDAAGRVSLTASGQSQAIEGQVCITATHVMSAYHLPAILKHLRETAPGIEVEVVASNAISDLRRREADIAIRHVRPTQPDLIARLVHESTGHLYAATTYLDDFGRPETADDLSDAAFIGFDDAERALAFLNGLGLSLTRRNFQLVTNSGLVSWEFVKQGLGIGAAPESRQGVGQQVEHQADTGAGVELAVGGQPDRDRDGDDLRQHAFDTGRQRRQFPRRRRRPASRR